MMRRAAIGAALAVLATGALAAAGCGGGDDATTEASATEGNEAAESTAADTSTASGGNLEIRMSEFAFDPSAAQTSAGKVTVSAPNDGSVVHELVLTKSDADPGSLPTVSNGEVDEEKLEADGDIVGEIADVDPGATKKATFNLKPGRYVMFCNLPSHYAQGMYGTIDVTG